MFGVASVVTLAAATAVALFFSLMSFGPWPTRQTVRNVAVQLGLPSVAPAKPAPTAALPTILKPGENWLSPSDITVLDGDTIRTGLRVIRLAGFDTPQSRATERVVRESERWQSVRQHSCGT